MSGTGPERADVPQRADRPALCRVAVVRTQQGNQQAREEEAHHALQDGEAGQLLGQDPVARALRAVDLGQHRGNRQAGRRPHGNDGCLADQQSGRPGPRDAAAAVLVTAGVGVAELAAVERGDRGGGGRIARSWRCELPGVPEPRVEDPGGCDQQAGQQPDRGRGERVDRPRDLQGISWRGRELDSARDRCSQQAGGEQVGESTERAAQAHGKHAEHGRQVTSAERLVAGSLERGRPGQFPHGQRQDEEQECLDSEQERAGVREARQSDVPGAVVDGPLAGEEGADEPRESCCQQHVAPQRRGRLVVRRLPGPGRRISKGHAVPVSQRQAESDRDEQQHQG